MDRLRTTNVLLTLIAVVLVGAAFRAAEPVFIALLLSVLLGALHVGLSNALEPKLMGDRLDLSFLVIFVSLLFWGWLWGPAGVLLAVPLTATVKIVLEHIPRTRRFALLLQRSRPRRAA